VHKNILAGNTKKYRVINRLNERFEKFSAFSKKPFFLYLKCKKIAHTPYNIIKELVKNPWINVVHFGTQKMPDGDIGRAYPANVKVIDGAEMEKKKHYGFGFSELPSVINSEKPDIVFIYNDMSIICNYIEEIRKIIQVRYFKIWAYAVDVP
jgi:hypothetical protein